jgi:hypothetical protein
MNVRLLKELMKQSETECGFSTDKFAELIILECADFIDSKFDISPYSGEVNSWADGSELKKHFGIES